MQTIHSADDHRADGRTYGNSWVFPGKRRVKPSSVMQEEMMSHSTPGTIGGEFTKWLRAWMLRSEKSRASVEQDQEHQGSNTRMHDQLGHRNDETEVKNADSDLSG